MVSKVNTLHIQGGTGNGCGPVMYVNRRATPVDSANHRL